MTLSIILVRPSFMQYTVIATYPEQGSQNIGDQLITNSVVKVISEIQDNSKITTIFRADSWQKVKSVVESSDHIIFACLAIRPHMHEVEYPYLKQIVESGIPFSVIAAGTQISNAELNQNFKEFSQGTISLLKAIDKKATTFTTRGVLSQYFCEVIGLKSPQMAGDVAFSMYNDPSFVSGKRIKRIAISDPHSPQLYLSSIIALYQGLRVTFPEASVEIFLHGINPFVKDFCEKNKIAYKEIYKDKDNGLDSYDGIDLHAGFRVHGHVTALSKGIYSYLLEQDGRGVEYGLTLNQRISVSDEREPMKISISGLDSNAYDSTGKSALKLVSMIRQDKKENFVKFTHLRDQIESFVARNKAALQAATGKVK
jgi:hypothetical protein